MIDVDQQIAGSDVYIIGIMDSDQSDFGNTKSDYRNGFETIPIDRNQNPAKIRSIGIESSKNPIGFRSYTMSRVSPAKK